VTSAGARLDRATLSRLGLLGSLYFAQGLPFGFFTQALPLLLRDRGYSLTAVGLSSLLAIPWALKFTWAPFVERHWWPRVGRRRSWILAMQLAATVVLIVLAIVPGGTDSMPFLMTATFALNLVAATQDIATDGLAVEILPPAERGFANGLQVAGYRVGMIIGGGVLLVLHDRLGARGTFFAMAGLTALASVPVLRTTEPPTIARTSTAARAIHFLRRPGAWHVVALLTIYKAGEAFAAGMLRPYLHDAGLSLGDVGWLLGTVGFIAGMLGALAGGALVNRLGRQRALVLFGVAQAITVLGYALAALGPVDRAALYGLCGVEHFASGMATAALFTCMMDWSRAGESATDYTVQASAVVIATGVAATLSGVSAEALGYAAHFALAAALCGAAIAAVALIFPHTHALVEGGPDA
jgi:RhtX/FptX family siderophore transporter